MNVIYDTINDVITWEEVIDPTFQEGNGVYRLLVIDNQKPDIIPDDKQLDSEWAVDYDNKTYTLNYFFIDKVYEWKHPDFIVRIKAPVDLLDTYPSMAVWMLINKLPIEIEDNFIYLYVNTILPQHQTLVDTLAGVITIENKPN